MRVLVIKTSSMGDVIHTLPALTDAAAAMPGIRFDWVVEEAFTEVPGWHPAVKKVIPVAIRRWRKQLWRTWRSTEWKEFKTELHRQHYDCVIDAQGLIKSAWLTRMVLAPSYGLDRHSIREPVAAAGYHHKIAVSKNQHAVERVRQLFAESLGYSLPEGGPDYGLKRNLFSHVSVERSRSVIFLHSTTWTDKHWPEAYWLDLCKRVTAAGYRVRLPWNTEPERQRAQRIAAVSELAEVLPRLNLRGVASVLAEACAVVAVDTGLGHLAAALDIPTVSLYGPTDPDKVGAYGANQVHLTPACCDSNVDLDASIEPAVFRALTPECVWRKLQPSLTAPAVA